MADNEIHAPAGAAAADGFRDVPSDIAEYQKFVADGGLEHNEKLLNREKAIADAKAAGILPEPGKSQEQDQEHLTSKEFHKRLNRLQRRIGEKNAEITTLRNELQTRGSANGANGAQHATEAGAASDKPASAVTAKPNGEAKQAPARPQESDFKTYGEYIDALTDWKMDRRMEKQAEESAAREAHRADADKGKTITDAHNARVDEAKKRYTDWGSAFQGLNDESFTEPMVVFIFESERGPDVTYYLAKHREELERIAKLPPLRQAAELGKIETRLEAEAVDNGGNGDEEGEEEPEPEEAPAPRKAPEKRKSNASQAPPPAKPIGGTFGKGSDDMPDPADFVKYEAWSRRQAAKGVKR